MTTKRDLLGTTAHISGWPVPARNPFDGAFHYSGSSHEDLDAIFRADWSREVVMIDGRPMEIISSQRGRS